MEKWKIKFAETTEEDSCRLCVVEKKCAHEKAENAFCMVWSRMTGKELSDNNYIASLKELRS